MWNLTTRRGPTFAAILLTVLGACTIPDRPPTLRDAGSGSSLDVSVSDVAAGDTSSDSSPSDLGRRGAVDTSGPVPDAPAVSTDARPDGTSGCTPGAPCVPANACHQGEQVCANTGGATCRDTGRSQTNGTACDTGVCLDGTCQACTAGARCEVGNRPCRTGSIACTTGAPVCTESDNKPNGTSCGGGNVCQEGICKACINGEPCTPAANACHTGRLDCAGAAPTCVDTGMNVPPGGACGQDKVCSGAGECVACVAGQICAVAGNPCRTGTTACNTGTPVCIETGNAPNGTSCGADKVCSGGACVACMSGLACVPANPCHAGTTVCSPAVECVDTGTKFADGTSCGADKVCSAGTCTTCAAGRSCTTSNACKVGTTSCTTGVSTCNESGDQPDGTTCGANQVCSKGACGACTNGAPCTPANPCHTGTLGCSTGTPVCNDSNVSLPNGTACGTDLVCRNGSCVSCAAGGACQPSDSCKVGKFACETGSQVCVVTGNKPVGDACGTHQVCNSQGACVTCNEGDSCTHANKCHSGRLSCASGAPVCTDTGMSAPNGTNCGTNLYCLNGTCSPCRDGQSCAPTNACKNGAISCTTGAEVCIDGTNKSAGTPCGPAQSCTNGRLTSASTCNANGQCSTPTVTQCASGACNAQGTDCLVCPQGQAVCGAACCAARQGCCGSQCTALDTASNCGACGNVCAPGDVCDGNGTCQKQTWCTTQPIPSGVVREDYQCLDFDTGLPPAHVWVPSSVTAFGTLQLVTDHVRSLPNALEAFVQSADELDPAALAPVRALTWRVTGAAGAVTKANIAADIYPIQPHGQGEGYVNYICLWLGGNRSACLSYAVPPEISPNAANFTITTLNDASQWCPVETAIHFEQWSRVELAIANNGTVVLNANGVTIDCPLGGTAAGTGGQVLIGGEGVRRGNWGRVVFDNLVTYFQR